MIFRILITSFYFVACYTLWSQSGDHEMVYTHVPVESISGYGWEIEGYKLRLINDTINWESELLQPLDIDSEGILFGVLIPTELASSNLMFTCTMEQTKKVKKLPWKSEYKIKERSYQYGGVNLKSIQLEIESDPNGAEVYLIPNRVWNRDFDGQELDNKESELLRFRVNSGFTNTHVLIDQTVFRILFRINDDFKSIIHYTQPLSVQPSQKVFVKF